MEKEKPHVCSHAAMCDELVDTTRLASCGQNVCIRDRYIQHYPLVLLFT